MMRVAFYKQEFESLFLLKGEPVLVDCSCMLDHRVGKLWITTSCIAFYSNYLGFKKKRSTPYDAIRRIEKTTVALGLGQCMTGII